MTYNNKISKNILITGGAGFIGSNFIPYFLKEYPNYRIINIDALTYAGDLNNLKEIENNSRYNFKEGNICDVDFVDFLFKRNTIDSVIHFAAESHVDNSIDNPQNFIKTNIEGTFVLLEAVKKYWMKAPNQPKEGFEDVRFHHISTDEVYGSLNNEGFFIEETAYAPNSPYSASKAASDFLVRSYHQTYGLNVVTSNCSNNYGPKQHDEKLIPTIIRKALENQPIPIYGDGKNVRDWLFVQDHCSALDLVFNKGRTGDTYVIGGNSELNNLYIANKICEILDEVVPKAQGTYKDQITLVNDRLGHDFRYAIDCTKIKKELGWKPMVDFDSGILKTVLWYIKKYQKEEK